MFKTILFLVLTTPGGYDTMLPIAEVFLGQQACEQMIPGFTQALDQHPITTAVLSVTGGDYYLVCGQRPAYTIRPPD